MRENCICPKANFKAEKSKLFKKLFYSLSQSKAILNIDVDWCSTMWLSFSVVYFTTWPRNCSNFIKNVTINKSYSWRKLSCLIQGQASGMDGTLTLIFAISETIRDSKKFTNKHYNTSKSYVKFQSLRDLAQKLGMPRPFVFWTQNGRNLLNFRATKKFKYIYSPKNNSS